MQEMPVAMHEDEVTEDAIQALGKAEREGELYDCPGCARWVYREDRRQHARTCGALRDHVTREATGAVRDAQPARLSGGAS